jgi:hypothetical protein
VGPDHYGMGWQPVASKGLLLDLPGEPQSRPSAAMWVGHPVWQAWMSGHGGGGDVFAAGLFADGFGDDVGDVFVER